MANLLLMVTLAHAEVVDRIVSVVGQDVVTRSDVEFEIALAERDESPVPVFEVGEPLAQVEDYQVLRRAAGSARLFQPEPAAVRERLRSFSETFVLRADYANFLLRWGLDGYGLREELAMRMLCERYVQRNVGMSLRDPTPWSWRQAYEDFMAPLRRAAGIRRIEEW